MHMNHVFQLNGSFRQTKITIGLSIDELSESHARLGF